MKVGDNNIVRRLPPDEKSGKIIKAEPGKEAPFDSLSIGRLIKAKVLSINQAGQALFSIGGKLFTLNEATALKIGQEVWLEVISQGNSPAINLAEKKGVIIDLLKLMFAGSGASEGSLKSSVLLKLPETLLQANQKVPAPLEDLIRLFTESLQGKEADPIRVLKQLSLLGMFRPGAKETAANALLQLLADPKVSGNILGAPETKDILFLTKILETINQHNNPTTSIDKNNCLLFPCFFKDDSGWGEWILSFNDDPNNADKQQSSYYTMTFMLEMSELGALQLQISLRDEAINGVFYVDNQEVMDHMKENLADLTAILKKLGFSPVNLSCQIARQGKIDLLKKILTEKAGYENLPLLDVTI